MSIRILCATKTAVVWLAALPALAQPTPNEKSPTDASPTANAPAATGKQVTTPTKSSEGTPQPTQSVGEAEDGSGRQDTSAPTEAATSGGDPPGKMAERAAPPKTTAKTEGADTNTEREKDTPATPSVEDSRPAEPKSPLKSLFTVHGFADIVWHTDPGYDLVDDDDVGTNAGISVDVDVLDFSTSGTLAVQLALSVSELDDGTLASDVFASRSIQAEHYAIGVVPRYAIFSWLEVHARLQGGVSDIYSEFETSDPGANIEQNDLLPFGAAGAGIAISSPARRLHPTRTSFNSVTFGGMVEGGYRLGAPISYAFENAEADPPEQRVRAQGAELGSLDRNGPYVRLGAFVRF